MTTKSEIDALYSQAISSGEGNESILKLKYEADAGDPYAQNYYGKILSEGSVTKRDRKEACKYFKLAAEQGLDESQFYLGFAKLNGDGTEKNEHEALKLFRISAEKGFGPAQFYLGMCYKNGTACYKDERYATSWFKRAADNGYSKAFIVLGDSFSDINNLDRDRKTALNYYLHAIEGGEIDGYYRAGMCYINENGEVNKAEALKCFEEGNAKGDCECEFMLGFIQIKSGTDKEKGQATIFHAAAMGSVHAKEYLDNMAHQKTVQSQPMEILVNRPDTPDVIGGFKGAIKSTKRLIHR